MKKSRYDYGFSAAIMCLAVLISSLDVRAEKRKQSARPPLVVMKQAEISGKVFFLIDDDTDAAASDIEVKVFDLGDEKLLQETTTDEVGRYALKNLDSGRYYLVIGRLRLVLRVEDADEAEKKDSLPKTIIIFMPKELGEKK